MNCHYPLLIPPLELAEKDSREWSKRQADAYATRLLDQVQPRSDFLLGYLYESRQGSRPYLLRRVGTKVEMNLKEEQFSTESGKGRSLTNRGLALAADAGLLIARFLIEDCDGRVTWTVVRRPKSDMSYNLPVLTGFGRMQLDPVGGSIAEARSLLEGTESGDIWVLMYEQWKEMAMNGTAQAAPCTPDILTFSRDL